MGSFLSVPYKLQDKINGLPGNARIPTNGTNYFEYPFSKAQKCGYAKSKMQFWRGIQQLIENDYVEIIVEGTFQGKKGSKKQNLYRLMRF